MSRPRQKSTWQGVEVEVVVFVFFLLFVKEQLGVTITGNEAIAEALGGSEDLPAAPAGHRA